MSPLLTERKKTMPRGSHFTPAKSASFPRRKLWRRLLSGLAVSLVSLVLGGMVAVKNQMDSSWQRLAGDFHWYVLIKGSQLEIDEVGRFLKQLDGVAEASFITPSEVVKDLQEDELLGDDFRSLTLDVLPPTWRINWAVESLTSPRLEDMALEIRSFPSVVDLAYNQNVLNQIHSIRLQWAQLRILLSLLALGAVLFVFVLFGRFFFFGGLAHFNARSAAFLTVEDVAWWAMGTIVAASLFGSVSWPWLLGGLAFGAVHAAWISTRDKNGA